jgi:general secretion pathway protein E
MASVEPFLLSSSLVAVLAQRLVRLLCRECRQPYTPSERERKLLDIPLDQDVTLYHASQCEQCNGTGYQGRTGIYELIPIDQTLRNMILDGAGEEKLEKHARLTRPSLRQDGLRRVLAGQTTLEEVLRVTRED